MDEQRTPRLTHYLPLVAVTTAWVAVCPTVAVWLLRDAGVINSAAVSILLGSALALVASYLGGVIWKSRSGAGDLLFSDLMIWGWLRRWRSDRDLANAVKLLAGVDAAEDLTRERREQMLVRLATSLEAGDPHTHGHSRRVARHAAMIAKRMGLSNHEIDKVRTAAALHDIGKLDTPRAILQKQDRLTDDEFDVVKQHPGRGAELVAILGDPELSSIVRHHHERIDGTGYPDRLSGNEIPLAARIVAVADVFDAITSTRPYRPARPHKEALGVLTNEAGTQLDADAVRAFHSCYAGRRPLALWAMLTNLPEKLFVWLGSGANTVAGSVAGVMATSAVASAVAVGAIASPLVSNPHLSAAATTARPASGVTGAPSSVATTASSTAAQNNQFAAAALKQPNPALMNAGTHALASTGARGTGGSSAPSSAQGTAQVQAPAASPTHDSTPTPAPGGPHGAAGANNQGGAGAATPAGSAGSGAAGGQGSGSGAAHSGSSGTGQSKASPSGSTAGNQGNGKGNGGANSQGGGNGSGSQSEGSGSAGSQGQSGGSGQTQGSSNGQGSGSSQGSGNATGQGSGNATGQGSGNATGQGNGNGQGNASGTAQSQVTTGSAQDAVAHGRSSGQAAAQN